MDCLPNEVLERILKYLAFADGLALLQGRRINKRWRLIVDQILPTVGETFWKRIAKDNIPKQFLMEILRRRVVKDNDLLAERLDRGIKWRTVFEQWIRSTKLHCSKVKYRYINALVDPITVVRRSGDFLITGHDDGMIRLILHTGQEVSHLGRHNSPVKDIFLLDVNREGPYHMTDPQLGTIGYTAHHILVSQGSEGDVQVITIRLADLTNSEDQDFRRIHQINVSCAYMYEPQVTVFEDNVVIASDALEMWKIQLPGSGSVVHGPLLSRMQSRLRIPSMHGVPLPRVMCASLWPTGDGGRHLKVELLGSLGVKGEVAPGNLFATRVGVMKGQSDKPRGIGVTHSSPEEQRIDQAWMNSPGQIVKAFLFRDDVTIFLDHRNQMYVSFSGFVFGQYNPMRKIQDVITTVLVYGRNLFIGTKRGSVLMYYVEEPSALTQLELNKPDWECRFRDGTITSLDVSHYGRTTFLTVATTNDLIAFEWPGELEEEEKTEEENMEEEEEKE